MSEWQETKLKDLCEKVTVGHVGSMADDYQDDGIPFLRSLNIKPFRLDLCDVKFINNEFNMKLRKSALHPGDVVVVRTGYPGTAAVIPKSLPISNCSDLVIIRPSKGLNPYFITAIFNSAFGQTLVSGNTVGAAQQHFNITVAKELRFRIPPKPVQDKIAAILSAYDELIEINQRRIVLLERMAVEIYREWFVRMRFPSYEQARFVKGVPDGWEVKRISEIVDFLSGYSFKSETYTPSGTYGVVTIKNVQEGYFIPKCSDFVEDVPSNVKKHCYLDCGDVLMSLTGNVGRVCHVYGANLLLNQRVAKLVPKLANASQFIFYTFNNESMIQLIENLSLGSTAQMNLSPILLGKQKMVVPSNEMLKKYEDMTIPMFQKKMSLLQRNMLLQETRDRLLPRLISGKLSVENLDIQFPPGMAENTLTPPLSQRAREAV